MFKKYRNLFWSYAKFYLSLPEMRLFWLFFFVVTIVSSINVVFLPREWTLIVVAFFVITGVMIFINGLRLARSNFEVKTERNQLDGIIKNLKDGLIAYDTNFKIEIFNPAAEQIFSIPVKEIVGQYFDPAFAQKPRYKFLAQVMFTSLAPTIIRRSKPGEWPQVTDLSFDNNLELRVITSRIVDSSGFLLGFFKLIQDRTRIKELLRAKGEFITIAAHQLRTPLTGVNWAFESLSQDEKLPEAQKQLVQEGYISAQRLLRVVNDLLEVSKIEEGKFGYDFKEVDLVGLINEILASIQEALQSSTVKLYFDRPSGEKKIVVRIDQAKIRMVIANLVDNAVKYNVENGEVLVKLEQLKDRPYTRISVKDTGIGIPPDEIDRLFTKFYRGSNAMDIDTTGSGLGLYIAKNIVNRHGGEIWAESVVGRGTVFCITLPTDPRLIPAKDIVYEEE